MILTAHGLHFAYNGADVLNDVSLSVEPGELLAILGPNGAGKTTLLKCLNAIFKPRLGTVEVESKDVLSMPPREVARLIGYVAQRIDTPRLSVFDAVLMGRMPHFRWNVSESDIKKTEAALRSLRLDHLALRTLDHLSGGELQKVAIARALVQEPHLILLDEPTSSLDLKNQVEILSLLRHVLEGHGMSAVMTMHDLNTALTYAHKFLFLKNGQVFAVARTQEVTPAMVEDVYGLPVDIHQIHGRPVVIPKHQNLQGDHHDLHHH
jgi:iron complex transport system ATP-binding protein